MRGRPEQSERVDLSPLIETASGRIARLLAVSQRNLIAFSGGKDSIVAAHIAKAHGISLSVCEISFCFPQSVTEFHAIAKHIGLSVEWSNRLDMAWLKRNQHLMFASLKAQGELYAKRQQATIKRTARKRGVTGIIYGRRREENTVRADLYQTADHVWHCHPLVDWSTANVWQYINDHGLPYPTLYDTPIGKLEGADPFIGVSAANAAKHGYNHFDLIHQYDPRILDSIADRHRPTRDYLKAKRHAQ